MIKIAFAEDHALVREAIADVIDRFGGFRVTCRACNGLDLINQIEENGAPDIAILDLAMPEMDGEETAEWLAKHHPQTAVLILTSYDSEDRLIPLVRIGIRGFMKKDIDKADLHTALKDVMTKGYYLGGDTGARLFEYVSGKRVKNEEARDGHPEVSLDGKEIEFIRHCCSDLTYKGIGREMGLSSRATDTLRDTVFNKLQVRTRVTLAMFAMRNKLME